MSKIKKVFENLKDESVTDILIDGVCVLFYILIAALCITVAIFIIQEWIKLGIIKDVICITIFVILGVIGGLFLIFTLGLIKRYFDKRWKQ